MTQTQAKRKKRAKPKRTKMRAIVELENNHVLRVPGEVYIHVGPLPDPDAEIAVRAGDNEPIGAPAPLPLGKDASGRKTPPPGWTSAGWKHEQTVNEVEDNVGDYDD